MIALKMLSRKWLINAIANRGKLIEISKSILCLASLVIYWRGLETRRETLWVNNSSTSAGLLPRNGEDEDIVRDVILQIKSCNFLYV